MIIHAPRLSVTTTIPSKKKREPITNAIMKYLVTAYGLVDNFRTDNREELFNNDLLNLCVALNIKVQTTGEESSGSNRLNERQNFVLSEMLSKVLEDHHCA